jgi:hypothetical protein
LPGVIAGSVIRVKLLPGPNVFDLVIAAVLLPLGIWLALTRPAPLARHSPRNMSRRTSCYHNTGTLSSPPFLAG